MYILYAHFAPKHVQLWDTEPISFLSGMMADFHMLWLLQYDWTDEHGTFTHLEIVPKDELLEVPQFSS